MRKHLQLLLFASVLIVEDAFSQNNTYEITVDCQNNLTEFVNFAKEKDFDSAYQPWLWCFQDCPQASYNIYHYGLKIVENRCKYADNDDKAINSSLLDSVFKKRITYFPQNLGKVYSDWASSLDKRGEPKYIVFKKLELAFDTEPTQMSIKNLVEYFKQVTEVNKDADTQKVFDTYDDVLEAVNDKKVILSKELDKLNLKDSSGNNLTSKEKLKQKNITINLQGLSQVEPMLDHIYRDEVSCERLISFYNSNFRSNKTNAKWLQRAVFKLFIKECTDNKLYLKMVKAWKNIAPSIYPKITFYDSFGDEVHYESLQELIKLIKAEKDNYKKADYYLRIAYYYRNRNKSTSRDYAYQALEARPSLGDAYLLIARLYATSTNKCGDTEFDKRIVYVAAADKAKKAKEVDPSVTAKAERSIDAYIKNAPGKWATPLHSTKDSIYKIKCWIGETVKYNPHKK